MHKSIDFMEMRVHIAKNCKFANSGKQIKLQ